MLLKENWVLVLSFMYLVSVDPMDRSLETIFSRFLEEQKFLNFAERERGKNHIL